MKNIKSSSYLSTRVTSVLFAMFGLAVFGAQIAQPGRGQVAGNSTLGVVSAVVPASVGSTGNTMMASVLLSNGYQQVALFDQSKFTLAIYHIDPSNGDIQLKSVRKLDADFSLQEFNLSEPTPSTIRKNVR